jgi:phage major head subunit gpT-like protein
MSATITDGDWQNALEPIARKNFELGFKKVPADRAVFYDVKKTSKLTETHLEIGDSGDMGEFTGDMEYEGVAEGYTMQITQREFAKGMKILRKFAETDQLNIVESLPKHRGLQAHRRMAADIFSVFNDAFTTAQVTLNSEALCTTTHASKFNSTTQSNKGTAALSAVNLETRRIAMKARMTNKDNLFEMNPDMLVVPRGLEETGFEIIKSNGKVDTAQNNPNFHKGRYKMVVSDWLDDSNNWFLIDSELMKQYLVWYQVVPLEFMQANDFDGLVAKYAAYMFYGKGSRDWRWIDGSEVS